MRVTWPPVGVHRRFLLGALLETIDREIKLLLLRIVVDQERRDLVPVLRAWFPDEIQVVRERINHALMSLGQRAMEHPKRTR